MTNYVFEDDWYFSLEQIKQEYPVFGTTNYHSSAYSIEQSNGSNISVFNYKGYKIIKGKPFIPDLLATYLNDASGAKTLRIDLYDNITDVK
jgi:alpha-galactosidase